MGEAVSVLYLAVYLITGMLLARCLFPGERPLVRAWLGGVGALLLLLWLPALFSFLFDFTPLSQWLALILSAAIGCGCFIWPRKQGALEKGWKADWPVFPALAPLFLLGVVLFFTHTLMPKDGALCSGQSTFGDLPLHLGLVTSLARQGTFPPMYSIYPGVPVGYPFLCDSISATFYVLGAGLRFSMLLPALLAYGLVLLGVYCFFERWLKRRGVAVFAALLFFLGGGFGFAYFFDGLQQDPYNLTRLFTAFYNTPTNFTEHGLIWVNPIADMLIPQRATLFGWALLFPALFLLRQAAFEGETKRFLPLGVLAGAMPLVHTHSFFALGVLSAVYLLRAILQKQSKETLLGWVRYGLTALILAAPQLLLFTFKQAGGFLEFHFNWANTTDSFLWFYVKNMGLIFLLLPLAFLRLPKEERWFLGGALILWGLCEFVQFQPNSYDNNKLIFVSFAFACGAVAELLIAFYRSLREWKGIRYLSAVVCLALFLSGPLTLMREWVSEYEQFSADSVEAAAYIEENTARDSLFLTANNHNNFVAALTGRNIFCGTSSYLYFHGIDYGERELMVYRLYEEPAEYFAPLQAQYGFDYVLFSDYEWYTYYCDEDFYAERFPVTFENESVRIYRVNGET